MRLKMPFIHSHQMPLMAITNPLSSTYWLGNPHCYFSLNLYPKPVVLPCRIACKIEVDTEKIERRIIKKGFMPTPKIIYRLRKKEIQKAKRKAKKNPEPEVPERIKKVLEEEAQFEAASREYELLMDELGQRNPDGGISGEASVINGPEAKEFKEKGNNIEVYREENERKEAVNLEGKPWERVKGVTDFRSLNVVVGNRSRRGHGMRGSDERLKFRRENGQNGENGQDLEEFRAMLAKRGKGHLKDLNWLLDDDFGEAEFVAEKSSLKGIEQTKERPPIDEEKQIQWLTERLNSTNPKMTAWQLSKLMHNARMKFTDGRLVRIVQVLGDMGNWRKAVEVVHWVHNRKRYKYCKGRYVYTTLIAVLGKARRPVEALNVFHAMREHISSYPDMPAYHSIAVTLGQAGYLKEILNIIDCLRIGPSKLMKNVKFLHWDPRLEPDVVVYNAVLNACVPWKQWKGAFWVLQQMRQSGFKPSSATYGLAMEVMLSSGKLDLVHKFFEKMEKAGLTPNGSTYRALVCAFGKEGKTSQALWAVEEMECRGVLATASVYFELACCLCGAGRWKDALLQVEKLCKCPSSKPLAVTFTGLIQSCAAAGHIHDCVSIFQYMQEFCAPNIGTINAMIKVYGQNNMFEEAKLLFEGIKKGRMGLQNPGGSDSRLSPDIFTYNLMLEACAVAHQWEYLENLYKQMVLRGHSIDQNQHAWLIVAASKSGKWHLLDHAFDQSLEMGEIPHISLYKEKICQSLQAREYAKVITYINNMAQGSLNITPNEWMQFFKDNEDRISKESWQVLLHELNSVTADDDWIYPILRNLITSFHPSSGLDTPLDSRKCISTLGIIEGDQELESLSSNISLPGEDGKATGDIQNGCFMDKAEQSQNHGVEKDTLNPLFADIINDDFHCFPDSSLPSSYDILREWRQEVKEKVIVEC